MLNIGDYIAFGFLLLSKIKTEILRKMDFKLGSWSHLLKKSPMENFMFLHSVTRVAEIYLIYFSVKVFFQWYWRFTSQHEKE